MSDLENLTVDQTQRNEPRFALAIIPPCQHRPGKNQGGFPEVHAVFLDIGLALVLVPFKIHLKNPFNFNHLIKIDSNMRL